MGSKETWKARFVRWLYGGKLDKVAVIGLILAIVLCLIGSAIFILAYHNYPDQSGVLAEMAFFIGMVCLSTGVCFVVVFVKELLR